MMKNKMLSYLFNPLIITSIFIMIILLSGLKEFAMNSFIFIFVPFVLYVIYAVIFMKVYRPKTIKSIFTQSQYSFSQILITVCCLTNTICILEIIKIYGDLQTVISWAGATQFTQKAQENAGNTTQFLFIINFLTPPALAVLVNRLNRRSSFLIIIFLVIQIILAVIFGTRIIFITSLSVIFIVFSYKIRMSLLSLSSTILFVLILMVSLIVIQSKRASGDYLSGIDEISNYYSISLNNGLRSIENEQKSQPLFWTLRPILALPVLPKASGIIGVYEEAFGAIQIRNRQDDFDYAKNLGVNPSYNTFSTFGYAFLDAGWNGILLIFIGWLAIQILFLKSMQGDSFSFLMFPILYAASIDQLRTYWFFTDRNFYALICALFIIVLPKFFNKTNGYKLRGKYAKT